MLNTPTIAIPVQTNLNTENIVNTYPHAQIRRGGAEGSYGLVLNYQASSSSSKIYNLIWGDTGECFLDRYFSQGRKPAIRTTRFEKTNVSISAGGDTTVSFDITPPSGYDYMGVMDKWVDTTRTTNPTSSEKIYFVNQWTESNTLKVIVGDLKGTEARKITVHVQILYFLKRYE